MKPLVVPWLAMVLIVGAASSLRATDINLTGYTKTFDEEFNTLSVTTASPKGSSTWFYWPPYGAAGGYSDSNWNIAALSVSKGILSDEAFWDPTSNQWQSGNISSMDTTGVGFAQEYGYFEARMKMPDAGTGAWPAFWLNGIRSIDHSGSDLEVDVAEWYGASLDNMPSLVQQASHNWNLDGSQDGGLYSPETVIPGASATGSYHIYGVRIDPQNITWYIDGQQTNQTATPADYNQPLYMMVDYALGGGWPLSGDPFPELGTSALSVDWVRVYQLPSQVVPTLAGVVSVQTHAGTAYPMNLPITGGGVEGRAISQAVQLVFTFSSSVTSGTAAMTGAGQVASTSFSGNTVTVNLSGVTDEQKLTVTLSGLNGTSGTATIAFGVLEGDVDGSGTVDSQDMIGVLKTMGTQNGGPGFQPGGDVNKDGAVNSQDLVDVRNHLGNHLP
jgi:beta-glucanase (GH16 family)